MNDQDTTLAELRKKILAFVEERDWQQFHSPKNLSMALAAETGELMEHFLWDSPEASAEKALSANRSEAIREELADVIIYAIEFANICEIDIAAAIDDKMKKNAQKYPVEKARGNALKYTELE